MMLLSSAAHSKRSERGLDRGRVRSVFGLVKASGNAEFVQRRPGCSPPSQIYVFDVSAGSQEVVRE